MRTTGPCSRPPYDSPSALSAYLDARGLAMSKRFGQNFLVNPDVRGRILEVLKSALAGCSGVARPGAEGGTGGEADPKSVRRVWEIGPGLGAMTAPVLDSGFELTAFEIDHGFARELGNIFGAEPRFSLIEGDFLDTWKGEFEKAGAPDLIFGNLPYNAASAFIASLLEGFDGRGLEPPPFVFTVQKEAAARMAAKPGCKDYSSFSVLCAVETRVKLLFDLAGGSFWPVPRVTSSVVLMTPAASIAGRGGLAGFTAFVRSCFASRRKTLRNNAVAAGFDSERVLDGLSRLGLPEASRAEALSPVQLASLYRQLSV